MIPIPTSATREGLVAAHLEIIKPTIEDPIIPFRFNPTEYQLQKKNSFAEITIPGLESPPIQFVRGESETLSLELLVDTSDTLLDVRKKYTNKLQSLMHIQRELHAPPIIRFVWDKQVFIGVLESLNTSFLLFTGEGIPLRAKLGVTLKEYRPAAIQVKERPTSSPDFTKSWVARAGESLSSIASAVYKDPRVWRDIAKANNIVDPRILQPGQKLILPQLR